MGGTHGTTVYRDTKFSRYQASFRLQFVACALCFTLITAITKQVPRYTRYRGIFFTVNTVDEILSTAHPLYEL